MKPVNESYESIINNLHDGLYFVDTNRVITFWNKAAERITGFTAQEVVGSSCADNILTHVDAEGNSLCCGLCPVAASMEDGVPRETEVFLHHKNGYRVPVSVRVSTLRDENGNITGGIELFTDISNQEAYKQKIQELEKLAYLDKLTNLANRSFVEGEIRTRFQEMEQMKIPFGVLFFDVDFFKKFNDNYGHDVGDEVLRFVADTFTVNARTFDLYARWGGEEFIAVIRNIDQLNLGMVGNRMRMLVDNSYIMHDGEKLHVSVSVGATMALENDDMDTLIKRADKLLYKSKNEGRNCLSLG